ncbi:type VI secretion system contractile sheath small subunit [Vibrio splendidus]|jgi:type VI secretion system protein ImpB|uniref:Type VI secretion system contractile sheath small subunit n=2 Tax=Vibrio TaxID=662 RepID=A0A1B9QBC4_9VIBR|nr:MULTISPECIES: type VI secretion system contractile sheath small subunit [Vibrio]OBS95884.1 type VI secretion system-associated protein [Vibrio tasmaniensis]KPL96974.1 type VI secretion protein [Vibrio splendidus]MBE8564236.1 type VI secretion system contractile sheath small subunit [Vibrio sp. OPT20]MBU2908081.1 type VI secretion system contractile sheath small subunit [Vibrio splendidus]MCB5360072.1 type VI secretion system contractile sheath small subunit [Vibrio lentus]
MSRDGSVAPKERINIRYVPATGDASDDVELPLSMMVVGDFTARADETPIEERNPINIDKDNFNEVLEGYAPNIKANVENRLSDEEGAQIGVDITFKNMKDFTPESIAKSVPELNGLLELREALVALKGPLGNVPAFRKKIAAVLQDEEARKKLLDELSIGADQGEKAE